MSIRDRSRRKEQDRIGKAPTSECKWVRAPSEEQSEDGDNNARWPLLQVKCSQCKSPQCANAAADAPLLMLLMMLLMLPLAPASLAFIVRHCILVCRLRWRRRRCWAPPPTPTTIIFCSLLLLHRRLHPLFFFFSTATIIIFFLFCFGSS